MSDSALQPASVTAGHKTTVQDVISNLCATVPDYPEPGVLFQDLTPVFADGPAMRLVIDALLGAFPEAGFDAVAGVEARGFLLAGAAAYASGTGTLTIRKAGKLPRATYREQYQLEYGQSAIELSPVDLPAGSRVLVLDDVLATGGTFAATARLLQQAGLEVAGFGVVLELSELGGRSALAGYPVHSLLQI